MRKILVIVPVILFLLATVFYCRIFHSGSLIGVWRYVCHVDHMGAMNAGPAAPRDLVFTSSPTGVSSAPMGSVFFVGPRYIEVSNGRRWRRSYYRISGDYLYIIYGMEENSWRENLRNHIVYRRVK
jgi:hypothetical protein